MATADIVLLVIIGLSALIGVVRGLLKEVFSLVIWVAALLLGLYFAQSLGEWLGIEFGGPTVGAVVAFVLVFIAVLIVGGVLRFLLGSLITSTGLTGTDRFLGFLFGAARGALVCIVLLIMLRPSAEQSDWWQASVLTEELLAFETEVLELMGRVGTFASEVGDRLELDVPDIGALPRR